MLLSYKIIKNADQAKILIFRPLARANLDYDRSAPNTRAVWYLSAELLNRLVLSPHSCISRGKYFSIISRNDDGFGGVRDLEINLTLPQGVKQ